MLSGVDVRVLVHEMEDKLSRSWITNIYQLPSDIFIFKLRDPQEGTFFLAIEPGKRIHLTDFNRQMPAEPPNFCKQLRSHLRDKRINWIRQRDIDRIVEINIGSEPGYLLVVELFGEGNLILVSPSNKILVAKHYRKMRDRDIHPGREFIQMPPAPRDLIRHGIEGLEKYLEQYPKLVIALNEFLGLGPQYSRYVLKEAGMKAKQTKDISTEEVNALKKEIEHLYLRLINHDYQPVVYVDIDEIETDHDSLSSNPETDEEDEGETVEINEDEQWSDQSLPFDPEKVVKIAPWPQFEIEGTEMIFVDTLNQAIDVFYSSQEDQNVLTEDAVQLETEADRLKRRLEQQKAHQQEMFRQAELERRKADAIYSYFNEINELLTTVYEARKKNIPWETIEEKLAIGKERGIKSAQILNAIKPKEGKLSVLLEYEGETIKIDLDFTKQIADIANDLYISAKKMEKKAKGADKAIEMTMEKIAKAEESAVQMRQEASQETIVLKRKKRWYEKWHWTIAPDGTIIVGGLDAKTNEHLVRKYLEPDDMFLHADIHGAPFVVIKSNGRKVSDQTAFAAATLGIAYSSAWEGKRTVADAFIVEPDQVSLQAPSGEFLPKGSIMIYGEKQYIKNVPVEIYIGLIIEANWARLIAGSKAVIDSHSCFAYAFLKPGDTQRGKLAKEIKSRFSHLCEDKDVRKVLALDVSEFAKMIPGDSKIEEIVSGNPK